MDADVIVIGAGAAGLAAARRLARSRRVILLEARDRVGGRVWSSPAARRVTPAELGAEFIHGKAPRTAALLREAGAAAIDIGDGAWKRAENGELQPQADDFLAAGAVFKDARTGEADQSVDTYLRRFQNDPALRGVARAARAFVEGFEAADPAIASARAIADEWASGVDWTSSRPLGGYAPVVDRLRNACTAAGVQLLLQTVVDRIAWRRGEVIVETTQAPGTVRTVRARGAIVTLPLGVLRQSIDEAGIAFEPSLPQQKVVALRGLAMGHVTKAVLSFRTAFWEELHGGRYRDAAFFRDDSGEFPTYWTQVPVRSELVTAWAAGPKSAAFAGLSPERVVDRALFGFGELVGDSHRARLEFENGYTHDWQSDPFSRGAYSYVVTNGRDARASLASPLENTLFFAGEATSTDGQGGTVNGALESGERAAGELLDV